MFDTAVFPVTPYAPPDAPRNNLVDASGLWWVEVIPCMRVPGCRPTTVAPCSLQTSPERAQLHPSVLIAFVV
jgi:hypothetical protein